MLSGGQPGNKNAAKAKIWEQALKRALARASKASVDAGLDQIADKVVAQALAGDKDAWDEIAVRMDGKPAQAVTVAGDEEGGPIRHSLSVEYANPAAGEG